MTKSGNVKDDLYWDDSGLGYPWNDIRYCAECGQLETDTCVVVESILMKEEMKLIPTKEHGLLCPECNLKFERTCCNCGKECDYDLTEWKTDIKGPVEKVCDKCKFVDTIEREGAAGDIYDAFQWLIKREIERAKGGTK